MSEIVQYQETVLDFFFNTIKWVFNDFLLRIEVLGIPVLWYFIAIIVTSILINGLILTGKSSAASGVSRVSRRDRSDNKNRSKKGS